MSKAKGKENNGKRKRSKEEIASVSHSNHADTHSHEHGDRKEPDERHCGKSEASTLNSTREGKDTRASAIHVEVSRV